MCRVQREKKRYSGSAGVYCSPARAKMEILDKADDTKLDRTVALKFLAPHL